MEEEAEAAAEQLREVARQKAAEAFDEQQREAEARRLAERARLEGAAAVREFLELAEALEGPSPVGYLERASRTSGAYAFRQTGLGYGLRHYIVFPDGRVLFGGIDNAWGLALVGPPTYRTSRWRHAKPPLPSWVEWSLVPAFQVRVPVRDLGDHWEMQENRHFVGRFRRDAIEWIAQRKASDR